jgi:hypothetical protein
LILQENPAQKLSQKQGCGNWLFSTALLFVQFVFSVLSANSLIQVKQFRRADRQALNSTFGSLGSVVVNGTV